jgi:5-methylcytosine-specific restriction endonuclease McrA
MRKRRRRYAAGEVPEYIRKAPHRRPTLHPQPPGTCKVCGNACAIGRNGRERSWHDGRADEPKCLHEWKLLTRPNYAKLHIAKERGNCCARCSLKKGRSVVWLHLDHTVPLADGGAFTIDNMQLLCEDCHGTKTARENSDRARARREKRAASVAATAALATPSTDQATGSTPARQVDESRVTQSKRLSVKRPEN